MIYKTYTYKTYIYIKLIYIHHVFNLVIPSFENKIKNNFL